MSFSPHQPHSSLWSWSVTSSDHQESFQGENYVGMYLRYKGEVNKVMAEYKVDIIDSAGKERESFKITTRDYQLEWLYGKPKWLKQNKLNDDLLPDGNLTIQCKVTVFGPEKIISANSNLFIHCQKQIGEDLGKVFSDKQFSDIKIQWEGQSFNCHMAILATRSPVSGKSLL